MLSRIAGTLLLLACLLQPAVGSAVILGQIDDFQDNTTQGWAIGAFVPPTDPAQPVNVPDGGPAGAGDHFMRLTAEGGIGDGSKLTVFNRTQWTGNYLAAGVNAITMSVKNLGATDLSLRLYVADDTFSNPPNLPPNAALSTKPVLLRAGSGWTFVVFPIAPANLTALAGSAQTALTNAADLRLFHNPAASFPGPAVVASLGVDDIHAVRGVPLPSLPLLLLFDD